LKKRTKKLLSACARFSMEKCAQADKPSATTSPSLPRHCERSEAIQFFGSATALIINCSG
jgi:hypothetical protein